MEEAKAEKALKVTLYVLCFWDLVIGLAMIFAPAFVAEMFLDGTNDDLFFVRATGISQLLAFYIQVLSAQRGKKDATALRLSIVFRFLFPPLYICHVAFLGQNVSSLVAMSLIAFSVLDYALTGLLCYLAKCLFGKWFP